MDHGDDFFDALEAFCTEHAIRAGYLPGFVGAFRQARLVGACGPLTNPEAPVWDEVEVESVEVVGTGTLAWDNDTNQLTPPTST